MIRCAGIALAIAAAAWVMPAAAASPQQFRNSFFLSCTREMVSGSNPLPVDLSMKVCFCSADTISTALTPAQLQALDEDVAKSSATVTPYIEACTQAEVPKYMDEHPEFVVEYLRTHPVK